MPHTDIELIIKGDGKPTHLTVPKHIMREAEALIKKRMAEERDDFVDLETFRREVFGNDYGPHISLSGARHREELTQAQLASMLGIKRHHISEMERGKRVIGKQMAKRLAKALKTDYRVFL